MAEEEKAIVGQHIVRYGIAADQKYLVGEFLDTYDQLVINASMVAHMTGGLTIFLTQRAKDKPYFIDPQTHAFQHELEYLQSTSRKNEGELKRPIKALLQTYGNPIERVVKGDQSILPDDFRDNGERKEFCGRVIDFQLDALADRAKNSEDAKYYEFLRQKGILGSSSLSFVVAPYFCMDELTLKKWLPVNIGCAADSKIIAAEKKIPMAVEIVISSSVLLDRKQIERMVECYLGVGADVFLIWIDLFDEEEVSGGLLTAFAGLTQKLKESGNPVVNLYGGYFSVLLMRLGLLSGVTHSMGYGEGRGVTPVGGGIPVAKYYLPAMHSRLRFRDALRAVRALGGMNSREDFHNNVCACKQCTSAILNDPKMDFPMQFGQTKTIRGREYPLPETRDNNIRHYMWCKEREYKEKKPVETIIEELKESGERLSRVLGLENTEHCSTWANALEGLAE